MMRSMRLPDSAHIARPWRIHAISQGFALEDVWALPTPGGPDELPRLVELIATADPERESSRIAGALFALRWKIGELLGWDSDEDGLGARVPTLRDRLPADLREGPAGPAPALPFRPLYLTHEEWAAEIANRTMHGVIHLGWVADEGGGYRGQMAVLVKPSGLFGRTYMAVIAPFRHRIVYPKMMRDFGRAWERRSAQVAVTEYTGGSRSAAAPHVTPASLEPNTSPDVAPK